MTVVLTLLFDIRHSKFEFWIDFDLRDYDMKIV